jgi:hypothetical protein
MSETSDFRPARKFRVKVGLAECTVTCESEQEAVRKARAELRNQMPHMSTVIQGIRDKEFRVDAIG